MAVEKDIKKIADFYGYEGQSRQLIEEMAELTQAVNKFWRKELAYGNYPCSCVLDDLRESENYSHIAEEIGDVEICLAQMKYLLNCSAMVERSKEHKVKRELDRIKEWGTKS